MLAQTVAAMLTALAVVLLAWQVVTNIPQLVKILRHRDAAGVSVPAELVTVLSGGVWASYALTLGDTALLASGLLAVVGYGPTAFVARRLQARSSAVERAILVLAVGGVAVGLALPAVPLSAVLLWFPIVQYAPYLWAVSSGPPPAGVSLATSASRAAYGATWALYGALAANTALILWGVATAGVFLAVAAIAAARCRPAVAAAV